MVADELAYYLQQHATKLKDISWILVWSITVLFQAMVLKIHALV